MKHGPLTAVTLGLLALFVPVSLTRLVDGDEGYLLYAARLIADGKSLYSDFFCPQAPLVPTTFAALFAVVGPSWYAARVLAAVLAVATGLFVFGMAKQVTRSHAWAAFAVFLYGCSGYTLAWLPIVKTYGLSACFAAAAIYVLARGGRFASLLGGAAIVLSMEARLYVGVLGLNAIAFTLRRYGWGRRGFVEIGHLALGAAVALLLLVPPFIRDFETAYFGIFEFASVRFPEQTTLFGPIGQKIDVLLEELSLRESDGAASTQLLALVVLAGTAWVLQGLPKNRLTATVWPTLLIVNLLPYNTFSQYVCVVVPFVVVEATLVVSHLVQHPVPRRVLAPFMGVYALMGALDVQRYNHTGQDVIGVMGQVAAWRIPTIEAVSKAVDAQGASEAASWWPGYFVTSRTPIIVGLANHFGFHVTGRYDEARLQRLRLTSVPELTRGIQERRYPLVVHGNWIGPQWLPLLQQTYELRETIANVSLWVPSRTEAGPTPVPNR